MLNPEFRIKVQKRLAGAELEKARRELSAVKKRLIEECGYAGAKGSEFGNLLPFRWGGLVEKPWRQAILRIKVVTGLKGSLEQYIPLKDTKENLPQKSRENEGFQVVSIIRRRAIISFLIDNLK
jgi:hypothetical protein